MFQFKLDDYFFPEISVKANPRYVPDSNSAAPSPQINIQSSFGEDAEVKDSVRVVLTIKVDSDVDGEVPYNVKIVGVGHFTLRYFENEEKSTEEEKQSLREKAENRIHYNGMSILYGAARDLIMTLTSRGPWEPVLLPMHFFNQQTNHAEDKTPDTTSD